MKNSATYRHIQIPSAPVASTFCASGYRIDPELSGELADASLLTATFYDGYSFLRQRDPLGIFTAPPQANIHPLGLATGTLTAVLGPGADTIPPLLSVSFFDIENHPIATLSATHRGDFLKTLSDFNLAGQPVKVTTELLDNAGQPTLMLNCESIYDRHGRPATGRLIYKNHIFNLGRTAYDRLGHIASTTYEGDITRSFTYDLHGWLAEWSCKGLTQKLSYADSSNPSYTGRISSKQTSHDKKTDTYIYSYDLLGRLTDAKFSNQDSNSIWGFSFANYSASYSYDLQGNMLTLKRSGAVNDISCGTIDDISATFIGNQLASLRDDAATVLLENSLDIPNGSWSGTDFAYDANGNQTRDMSRGVADITYNELNLPARIEFEDGATIEYLYSASGTKLAEIPSRIGLMAGNRRDYVGLIEYEQNKMTRIALTSGYITMADTLFHLFVPDHQGNIMAVIDAKSGKREHYHDYYPYGMPHVEINSSTTTLPPILPGFGTLSANEIIITPPQSGFPQIVIPSKNRRLYSAKELTTDYGLNAYDFEARWLTPAFPRFTTIDRFAEKYYPISPYVYTAGDPINFTDITGDSILVKAPNQQGYAEDYYYIPDQKKLVDFNGNTYVGSDEGTLALIDALNNICDGNRGKELLTELSNSTSIVMIRPKKYSNKKARNGERSTNDNPSIYSVVTWFHNMPDLHGGKNFITLAHELGHSLDRLRGTINESTWYTVIKSDGSPFDVSYAEIFAIHIENIIRGEHGIPLRMYYEYDKTGIYDISKILIQNGNQSVYINQNGHPNPNFSPIKPNLRYKYNIQK